MKKVLLLQVKSNSFGGVWFVNKTIGHKLLDNNYDVKLLAIRRVPGEDILKEKRLDIITVNEIDKWEITHFEDVIKSFKEVNFLKFIKVFNKFLKDRIKLKTDYKKAKKIIEEYNPDYIISTHYQLLDVIPKKYFKRTIHEQHTSLTISKTNKANIKTFNKYKNKINFVWLTKATADMAINEGYLNSRYIYNPVKLITEKKADVVNNKKIITINRYSPMKKIEDMIDLVEDIFKNDIYKDWKFEIYCDNDNIKNRITNKKQIKYMGPTNNVEKAFLSSSINLSMSTFEGFPMSVLEACECGVPTITYNFGESVYESVKNNKTGIIIENRDSRKYKEKLESLMSNNDKLLNYSNNAKLYAKDFHVDNIIKHWINLFNEIDKNNSK